MEDIQQYDEAALELLTRAHCLEVSDAYLTCDQR